MNIIKINKNNKGYKKLHFVTGALSRSYSRPILTLLKVENNIAMACDGYRLHEATNVNLPDGLYSIKRRTKTTIELIINTDYSINRYPDVNKIKPNNKDEIYKTIEVKIGYQSIDLCYIISEITDNTLIDIDYLKDALIHADNVKIKEYKEKRLPYEIITNIGYAVIMGCIKNR